MLALAFLIASPANADEVPVWTQTNWGQGPIDGSGSWESGYAQDPWWGDPGYRIIPRGTKTTDIRVYHLHINPAFAEEDLNCLLPLQRLDELAEAGLVADSALNHYSYMGYLIDPTEFLRTSVPAMIEKMREEAVDVVVLVPS